MSLESIGLIGVLTLLTIVLGSELFLLLVGRSALDAVADTTLLDVMCHVHSIASQRMTFVFVVLLNGTIALNLVTHTRTEVYLLRIGLGSLILYAAIVLFGSLTLGNKFITALDTDSLANIRS